MELISGDGKLKELDQIAAMELISGDGKLKELDQIAAMELISGDGKLKELDLEGFKRQEYDLSYCVGIMGPQGSGKSTLLNHLFGTSFLQRDPSTSRWKGMATTKGVWIAEAQKEPFTLVMDLEGTDGKERGQDGTAFEKRSALFALAVAHSLLINMWCHDFGREHASNRPLLRTIFESVITMPMSSRPPRKTTLLFVVRDMSSYDESLETPIKEDVQKIWEEVRKPEGRELTPLTDFFNVEYFPMSSYREKRETFEKEVKQLRQKILNSISHGVDRQQWVVPASRFCSSIKEKWTAIKQNDNLDLPAHKVMVATMRCEEIVKKKLQLFAQDWVAVEAAAETGVVSGLSARISSILSRYISEYDSETLRFDQNVRNEKRKYLESEALRLVHPAYAKTLGHLRSEQFQSFQTQLEATLREGGGFDASAVRNCRQSCVLEFDRACSDAVVEQAGWNDASTVRGGLLRDIENHTLPVRKERSSQVFDECRERLSTKLNRELRQIFTSPDEEITWEGVRGVLSRESDAAASDLRSAVVGFEVDSTTVEQKVNDIKRYARNLVENKFKDETAGGVLKLMKQRYTLYIRRILEARELYNKAAHEEACRKCLKFLSVMAVIRLDEGDDNVESVLVSAADGGVQVSEDPLAASSTWEGVSEEVTLITPAQCKATWEQFKTHVDSLLPRVNLIQRSWKKANRWLPPTWVIVGLAVLGFTGLKLFLRGWNLHMLIPVVSFVVYGISAAEKVVSIYRNANDHFERKHNDSDVPRKNLNKGIEEFLRVLKELEKLMKIILPVRA